MNKQTILDTVRQKINAKKLRMERLIAETRASNNDTKSSMGDKYETGREMLQQEINNLQIQLNEVLKQLDFLKTSFESLRMTKTKAEKGALVKTERGLFFISVSLGEITFENQKIICISPESPLAKAMLGKQKNDSFTINGIHQKIDAIW